MAARLIGENGLPHVQADDDPTGATAFPSLTEGESVPSWNQGSQAEIGVDRLSISFPVRDWIELPRWDSVRRTRDGDWTAQTSVGGVGLPTVMVGVKTVAGRPWGKVECNPSRFTDPGGFSTLDPRQLSAAFTVMWSAAWQVTTPICELAAARVKRGDIARDFREVTAPTLYVEGLGPIRRPYARRSFTYNDPQRANSRSAHRRRLRRNRLRPHRRRTLGVVTHGNDRHRPGQRGSAAAARSARRQDHPSRC
jgi:hypothetical protein